mgnify:CR=1 FL=1
MAASRTAACNVMSSGERTIEGRKVSLDDPDGILTRKQLTAPAPSWLEAANARLNILAALKGVPNAAEIVCLIEAQHQRAEQLEALLRIASDALQEQQHVFAQQIEQVKLAAHREMRRVAVDFCRMWNEVVCCVNGFKRNPDGSRWLPPCSFADPLAAGTCRTMTSDQRAPVATKTSSAAAGRPRTNLRWAEHEESGGDPLGGDDWAPSGSAPSPSVMMSSRDTDAAAADVPRQLLSDLLRIRGPVNSASVGVQSTATWSVDGSSQTSWDERVTHSSAYWASHVTMSGERVAMEGGESQTPPPLGRPGVDPAAVLQVVRQDRRERTPLEAAHVRGAQIVARERLLTTLVTDVETAGLRGWRQLLSGSSRDLHHQAAALAGAASPARRGARFDDSLPLSGPGVSAPLSPLRLHGGHHQGGSSQVTAQHHRNGTSRAGSSRMSSAGSIADDSSAAGEGGGAAGDDATNVVRVAGLDPASAYDKLLSATQRAWCSMWSSAWAFAPSQRFAEATSGASSGAVGEVMPALAAAGTDDSESGTRRSSVSPGASDSEMDEADRYDAFLNGGKLSSRVSAASRQRHVCVQRALFGIVVPCESSVDQQTSMMPLHGVHSIASHTADIEHTTRAEVKAPFLHSRPDHAAIVADDVASLSDTSDGDERQRRLRAVPLPQRLLALRAVVLRLLEECDALEASRDDALETGARLDSSLSVATHNLATAQLRCFELAEVTFRMQLLLEAAGGDAAEEIAGAADNGSRGSDGPASSSHPAAATDPTPTTAALSATFCRRAQTLAAQLAPSGLLRQSGRLRDVMALSERRAVANRSLEERLAWLRRETEEARRLLIRKVTQADK